VGVREWMREVDAECAACGEEGSMEEEGFEGLVEGKVFGVGSRLLGVERKTSLFGDEEVVGESDEVARSYGLDLEGAGVVEGESLDGGGGVKGEGVVCPLCETTMLPPWRGHGRQTIRVPK
jgi:hypothetical protein